MKFVTTPTYELTLPSSGKKIKYRPFVVKEEKLLLLAIQENNEANIISTVKNIINHCTFNELEVEKLPSVDLEYVFIKMRNKSLGEGLELEVTCHACNKKNPVMIDLDAITVTSAGVEDKTIVLTDNLKVTMRYPTLEMSYNLSDNEMDRTTEMVAKCIEFIEYQGKLYDTAELPFQEVMDFIENLTQAQLKKLDEFLEGMPKVVFQDTFKCKYCQAENEIDIEGINSFFG